LTVGGPTRSADANAGGGSGQRFPPPYCSRALFRTAMIVHCPKNLIRFLGTSLNDPFFETEFEPHLPVPFLGMGVASTGEWRKLAIGRGAVEHQMNHSRDDFSCHDLDRIGAIAPLPLQFRQLPKHLAYAIAPVRAQGLEIGIALVDAAPHANLQTIPLIANEIDRHTHR
jgi:hypothetical protein